MDLMREELDKYKITIYGKLEPSILSESLASRALPLFVVEEVARCALDSEFLPRSCGLVL